jgi:hypothetical protein
MHGTSGRLLKLRSLPQTRRDRLGAEVAQRMLGIEQGRMTGGVVS